MSDIQSLIQMLQSDNHNKRYDACEELRVLPSLPLEALEALRLAANDPNPDVADAAQRVIALHSPKKTLDVVQSKENTYAEDWGIRYFFALFGGIAGVLWGFSLLVDSFIVFVPLVGGIIGAGVGWVIGIILEGIIKYFIDYYHKNRENSKKYIPIALIILITIFITVNVLNWIATSIKSADLKKHVTTPEQQIPIVNTSECISPILDGGDGLETTGCGKLEVGVIVGDTTSSTSEAHNWQFSTQQNERVKFLLLPIDSRECPTLNIKFLDAQGDIIRSSYVAGPSSICLNQIRFLYFDPPTSGTYILRIETPDIPGEYRIEIEG